MSLRITSDDRLLGLARRLQQLGRNPIQPHRKIALFLQREARRRAPRKTGSLARSLESEATATAVIISSKLAYAAIQAFGGTIRGGSANSKLSPRPKNLAIPLNEKARKMSERLGASVSLRTLDLALIVTKAGKKLLAKIPKRGRKKGQPEFLFILKPLVELARNPSPRGYMPTLEEPKVRDFILRTYVSEARRLAKEAGL